MITQISPDNLPASVAELVESFDPCEAPSHVEELELPLSQWYWRSVAAVCLSHRIKARQDGGANKVDANRFAKEANFNQIYLSTYPLVLEDAGILTSDWRDMLYKPGPNFDIFWAKDQTKMRQVILDGVRKGLRNRCGLGWETERQMWQSSVTGILPSQFWLPRNFAFQCRREQKSTCKMPRAPEVKIVRQQKCLLPQIAEL